MARRRQFAARAWCLRPRALAAACAAMAIVLAACYGARGEELMALPAAMPAVDATTTSDAAPGPVNEAARPDLRPVPMEEPAPLFSESTMPGPVGGSGLDYDWVFDQGGPSDMQGQTCDESLVYEYAPYGIQNRRPWHWQMLPNGLIYRSYLAGPKEPRLATVWLHDQRRSWYWDTTLGGRVGILRYGDDDDIRPNGFQVDVEGAAFPRLDLSNGSEMVSADFRGGVPLTFGIGPWEAKLAYYHLSSHLGDEYMISNPTATRVNYVRDAIVLGGAVHWWDVVRLYGEVDCAIFQADVSRVWHFQVGAEYSPLVVDSFRGTPFAAINALFRQEVNYAGTLTVQGGWQWNGVRGGQRFRVGLQYLVGNSPQLEFYDTNEQSLGAGLWYDY
jgi:hypothetical protein